MIVKCTYFGTVFETECDASTFLDRSCRSRSKVIFTSIYIIILLKSVAVSQL